MGWSMDRVHMGGPWTGSMGWSTVVHGPGPWGGPWTPVHVLYTSDARMSDNEQSQQRSEG